MIRLSKRLQAVADLVSKGTRVCDVGTDHAYIPIYLIQTGRMEQALAMDVNEGPLLRAKEHVAEQGLSEYIVLRRSDGLTAMGQEGRRTDDADTERGRGQAGFGKGTDLTAPV